MKALVEPLPFVPAIWMGFRRSKSDGYDLVLGSCTRRDGK